MATVAINSLSFASAAVSDVAAKPSFFGRFMRAVAESRQRQAEIEIRRVRALIGEPKDRLDYAMLPFAGE
jgi:hypothetical protein